MIGALSEKGEQSLDNLVLAQRAKGKGGGGGLHVVHLRAPSLQ